MKTLFFLLFDINNSQKGVVLSVCPKNVTENIDVNRKKGHMHICIIALPNKVIHGQVERQMRKSTIHRW